MSILDFIPIVNTLSDLVGMASGGGDAISGGGAIAKLASTVVTMHLIAPYLEKFTSWTDTKKDDKAYDFFMRGLGLVTKVMISLGKIDPKDLKKKLEKKVEKRY